MSNRASFLRRGWVRENAPLNNGLGRFIPQLMRLTIKFCKERPSSSGVREYIEQDVVSFAKNNPSCALYLKPRRNRVPVIVAEYLNGEKHRQVIDKYSCDEIRQWMDVFKNASGKEYQVQLKYEYSDHPSIQGAWTPFTNADPAINLAQLPDPESLETRDSLIEMTATDRVRQLFAEQEARVAAASSSNTPSSQGSQ